MCGIAGILNLDTDAPVGEPALRQMLALLRHRGPDEFGIFLDDGLGLGSARLSIVDLNNGQQPICNEDHSLWIVFNGEIFNHLELREELASRGHRFRTHTDTEVLLHLFEEAGEECLSRLNGQFAFALWNARQRSLFLARDRFGVRPLFFTRQDGALIFGSEIKALLGSGRVRTQLDPLAVAQTFTFWSTLSPQTVFQGISELPPGHWLRASARGVEIRRYWQLDFAAGHPEGDPSGAASIQDQAAELHRVLTEAVRLRLRGDVPVAAYLSGGLDSSVIAALALEAAPGRLNTFSISFEDAEFDESNFQQRMARHLGTKHEVVHASHKDVGRVFPEVIWHCETPVVRTSPGPMYLLSQRVRQRGFKVALSGEGADELLGGYDLFKEAKIRRWWAARPDSTLRPRLLGKLYPDIADLRRVNPDFLKAFFGGALADTASPFYSHLVRWRNGKRARRFFSDDLKAVIQGPRLWDQEPALAMAALAGGSEPLARAQSLEIAVFLAGFLLSSQGDRMGMAHSVEGRFPFLDVWVAEFCAGLPARLKLRALNEKFLLRRMAAPLLPPDIAGRPKRPYRAPIHRAFFHPQPDDYVEELLSPPALRESGFFNPAAVAQLVAKLKGGAPVGETDDMALAGILSTQLVHHRFIRHFAMPPPLAQSDPVKVCADWHAWTTAPEALSYAFS